MSTRPAATGLDVTSLDQLTARSAELWPDRTAMIDGSTVVTHAQLNAAVTAIAWNLVNAGLRPGMRCAIAMDHTWTNYAAFIAAGRAGLVALPLNPKLTPVELKAQAEQAQVDALLVSGHQSDRLAGLDEWEALRYVGLVPDGSSNAGATHFGDSPVTVVDLAADGVVDVPLPPDAPGTLWFTGGSTGAPKLVVHARRSPVLAIDSWIERLDLTEKDRGFALNFCHISTLSNTGAVLAAGGSVILIPEFRVPTILALIEQHRATLLITLSLFVNLLVREPAVVQQYDLSTLRTVLIGGSPTERTLWQKVVALLPHVRWGQAWAQTELCSGGTAALGDEFMTRPASVGRPLSCVTAIEIRGDHDRLLPHGTVGEVCVLGEAVMQRYDGDPPGETNGGLMRTGDLGYLDADGYLYLVGRKREVIIRGGENLFPAEIEAVIASHPAVHECAVVGIPDSVMTEVPVAFVIPVPGATISPDELAAFANDCLTRFKQPVAYEVVRELPRNSIGKIQKAELRGLGARHSR
jgi:acyl-CoA synthetase (AMP-forming)/AMP-acid ligase II